MSRRRYPTPRPARRHARSARVVRLLVGVLWTAVAALGILGVVKGWR